MSLSGVTELTEVIPSLWSSELYDSLKNNLIIANFFSRDWEGEMGMGRTVYVNQLEDVQGEILTNDKALFNPEALNFNQKSIVVDKRAVASVEITDLSKLQSISFQEELQQSLVYALRRQLETDVINALIPSASAPDHQIAPASASDLAAADVAELRRLLSVAKTDMNGLGLFLASDYYSDLLLKTTLISNDYRADSPVSSGSFGAPIYGFNVAESNMLAADTGFACHRSALQLVMQEDISVEVVPMKSQRKFSTMIVASMVFGHSLFDDTRIVKISG